MNEKKYTPGPWHFVNEPETNENRPYVVKDDGYYLADIYSDIYDGEANARLISCSPELLEALESIYNNPNTRYEVEAQLGKEMWDIIAKAKGDIK